MVNPLFVRALCVADVVARWRWKTTKVEAGRCYSQVADGIAIILCYFYVILVLGCQTEPHPIYVVDGIYPHFC